MANMSYCRFENTKRDFWDCLDALQNEGLDSLSDTELDSAKSLYILCKEYVEEFENQND